MTFPLFVALLFLLLLLIGYAVGWVSQRATIIALMVMAIVALGWWALA